jgi:hypothetical protein
METLITPADLATRFIAKLTPQEVAYAIDAARGEYRGFAALHDLFDANEELWKAADSPDDFNSEAHLELLNAAMEHINARLLAKN